MSSESPVFYRLGKIWELDSTYKTIFVSIVARGKVQHILKDL